MIISALRIKNNIKSRLFCAAFYAFGLNDYLKYFGYCFFKAGVKR